MRNINIICNRCGKDISKNHANTYEIKDTTTITSMLFGDYDMDLCDECNSIFINVFINEFVRGCYHK